MSVIDMFRLDGKVALLTGGAGMYGRQILAALAEAGAEVCIASRNVAALEEVAAEHRKLGHRVNAYQLELADEASVLALRDALVAEHGKIDILINNAMLRTMPAYESGTDKFAESMEVNATGLYTITRAIGDAMASTGSGSIINIGSIFGMVGYDPWVYEGTDLMWGQPDYSFCKGGMIAYTKFIASQYGAKGVRCNCLSPGGLFRETMPERFVRQYERTTCLGRMANSTDLKGGIVFLASDASAYITGANIPVDGGRTAI